MNQANKEIELLTQDSLLLNDIAFKIPTILSWEEFLEFREYFIEKYKELCKTD